MTRYRSREGRHRGGGSYRRSYSPYLRRDSPYQIRRGSFYPYYRSRRSYEIEPSEQNRTPLETRYGPKPEKQSSEAEPKKSLLSREEFFERYPPNFPKHWNQEFRKEVMDTMYDRYVDSATFKALSEKIKAEEEEKQEEKNDEGFDQDPQDKLLEIIKEKGIGSPEGKAAYEDLMKIQLEEINRHEDEYRKEEAKLSAKENVSERTESLSKNERIEKTGDQLMEAEPKELNQAEVEGVMEQLENELFEKPENLEPNEVEEKAEHLAEEALEIDAAEMEELVQDVLEETRAESFGPEGEPAYEADEEEDDEVY